MQHINKDYKNREYLIEFTLTGLLSNNFGILLSIISLNIIGAKGTVSEIVFKLSHKRK